MREINKKITVTLYLLMSLCLLMLSLFNSIYGILGSSLILLTIVYLAFMYRKLTMFHYVSVLIISIALSPMIKLSFMFADLRLDDLWLAFGAVILMTKLAFSKGDFNFNIPSYAKLFSIFIIWIVLTIAFTAFGDNQLYSNRDWTEVYKSVKLLIYLLIVSNMKLDDVKISKISNMVIISLLLSALFGIAQYFNLLNINSWLTPYYIYETKIYNLETQKRVVGTFGNPNTFGIALVVGIALTFAKILEKYRMKYLIAMFVFFLALTLSLSRTALVVSIILIAFMFLKSLKRSKGLFKPFLFVITIPLVSLLVLRFAPENFFYRVSFLNDLSQDSSFQARLRMWEDIWLTLTKDNIIFGNGAISRLSVTFDNEWLMLLTYYGIIGVLLFILSFLFFYRKLNRAGNNFYITLATRGLIIAFSAAMVVTSVYHLLQVMPLIIIVIALNLNNSKNKEGMEFKKKRYKLVW